MTGRVARRGWLAVLFALVWLLALLRQPMGLLFDEPTQFAWRAVPDLFGLQGGYLQVFAHAAFLAADPFGAWGPLVTRIIAAAVIAAVAVYLASDALAPAIPSRAVRLALVLSLPLYPVLYAWGPYLGPLNSQWWFSIAVVAVALARPRRWHWPALFLAGLSGIAPCVALPVFRDRRGLALAAATAIQGVIWLLERPNRQPLAFHLDAPYLLMITAVIVTLAVSGLSQRTRLAFAYLALAEITLGAVLHGMIPGNDRYLTGAWVAVTLGSAFGLWKVRRVDLCVADVPRRRGGRPDERPVPDAPAGLLEEA